jgi:hypothetical protein
MIDTEPPMTKHECRIPERVTKWQMSMPALTPLPPLPSPSVPQPPRANQRRAPTPNVPVEVRTDQKSIDFDPARFTVVAPRRFEDLRDTLLLPIHFPAPTVGHVESDGE